MPGWRVEEASRERAKAIAQTAGVSPSQFIDALIQHQEVDERGLPPWWPSVDASEELPIDST